MKLIFNAILLCHVLQTSISYYMYPHRMRHFDQHNYFELNMINEDLHSDSEDDRPHRHYHLRITNSDSYSSEDECSRSRNKCYCDYCPLNNNQCCIEFCKTMCLLNYQPYLQYPATPEVIVLPYPVPMMIMPPIKSLSSTSEASSTQKSIETKSTEYIVTTENTAITGSTLRTSLDSSGITEGTAITDITGTIKSTATTESLKTKENNWTKEPTTAEKTPAAIRTKTESTQPPLFSPKSLRAMRKKGKRFKLLSLLSGYKKALESRLESNPKFGLVRLPKYALNLKQLKDKKKLLLEERRRLLNLDKRRFLYNKGESNFVLKN